MRRMVAVGLAAVLPVPPFDVPVFNVAEGRSPCRPSMVTRSCRRILCRCRSHPGPSRSSRCPRRRRRTMSRRLSRNAPDDRPSTGKPAPKLPPPAGCVVGRPGPGEDGGGGGFGRPDASALHHHALCGCGLGPEVGGQRHVAGREDARGLAAVRRRSQGTERCCSPWPWSLRSSARGRSRS